MLAPTYPADEAGLTQALAALGDTAAAVAGALRTLGCTGHLGEAAACPIADYLTAALRLGGITVEVNDEDGWHATVFHFTGLLQATLPGPVRAFVEAFDSGECDDLVRNTAT